MMRDFTMHRLPIGCIIGLALYAAISEILLLAGLDFFPSALPIALVTGLFLAGPRPPVTSTPLGRTPTWATIACLALIAGVAIALTYGSLATPSRHWDGVVAWELKAQFLTATPSLDQDFFTGRGVFHHSRDYPLLQPLCIAAGNRLLGSGNGRALFPLLYLVMLALAAMTMRHRCTHPWLVPAGVLAIGLTPMLVNPVMGGADSGFADLFLATAVAGIAAGMVLGIGRLLAAAIFIAVLVKPEGMMYGALPIVIFWFAQERRAMRAAMAGYGLALAIWLPLQNHVQQLCQGDSIITMVIIAILVTAALVVFSDLLLTQLKVGSRGRILLISLTGISMLLAAPMLVNALGNQHGTLGVYLSDTGRIIDRLPRIGAITFDLLDRGIINLRFAVTYLLLVVIFARQAWCRRKPCQPQLAAYAVLGLLSLFLAFLLSPEEMLDHHIRSSMDRLLLHWLTPVWLLMIFEIDAAMTTGDQPVTSQVSRPVKSSSKVSVLRS